MLVAQENGRFTGALGNRTSPGTRKILGNRGINKNTGTNDGGLQENGNGLEINGKTGDRREVEENSATGRCRKRAQI